MRQCIHPLGGMITGGSGVMVTDGVTDVVTDGVTDVGEGERGSNFMKKCNFSIKNNMYIPRFFVFMLYIHHHPRYVRLNRCKQCYQLHSLRGSHFARHYRD